MFLFQPTVYHSKFLKADMRAVTEKEGASISTSLFDGMIRLDDISVPAGSTVQFSQSKFQGVHLLLPVAGEVSLTKGDVEHTLLPGNIYTLPARELEDMALRNPFEDGATNLLHVHTNIVAADTSLNTYPITLTSKNALVAAEGCPLPVYVGVYDSRVKDSINVSAPDTSGICYLINGSFEIEDRLAEHRDALLLWNTSLIEFEALSEAAILLHIGSLTR